MSSNFELKWISTYLRFYSQARNKHIDIINGESVQRKAIKLKSVDLLSALSGHVD